MDSGNDKHVVSNIGLMGGSLGGNGVEDITIGQIGAALTFIVGFMGGIVYLKNALRGILSSVVKQELEPLRKQVDKMQQKIDRVDMESCKNFLVRFLSELERGEGISETERERFWEQYEHYIEKGHNSYIKSKVEQLRKQGKL